MFVGQDARAEVGLSCAYRSIEWTIGAASQVLDGDNDRGGPLPFLTTAIAPHQVSALPQAPVALTPRLAAQPPPAAPVAAPVDKSTSTLACLLLLLIGCCAHICCGVVVGQRRSPSKQLLGFT